ncbi:MAG: two-component system, OmpR family, alkaline phosphatase synthesis response regulator PhoP [Parcubacteria group bacterium Gr01-1014_30]|nr:MAG: two-component system, OmpR family, alkaline phosphatase synthesis response regulator PhoP [Parcubacteria group bacterium Gr01-1014_30]
MALKAKKARVPLSGSPCRLNNMKKILFIEDEAVIQKTIGDVLRQKGYDMASSLDGESGLRIAKSMKPDLILLDLILPKMNGFEVLKELKGDEATRDIPVIVLTNLEGVGDIDRVIELGAKTYLVKAEYSLEEVVDKIKKTLGE